MLDHAVASSLAVARVLDDQQRREIAEFVNALARLGDYQTSAEWAGDAGYPQSNLSLLRGAKAGIDGYNLLKLIRAVAHRVDELPVDVALAAARDADLEEAPSRAELARHLEELSTLIVEGLARLEALVREGAGMTPENAQSADEDREEGPAKL